MGPCLSKGEAFSKGAFGLPAEEYRVQARLGEGHEGTTYLVRELRTGQLMAAKIMRRGRVLDERYLLREITTQSCLRHAFIVRLFRVLLTPTHIVLLMEYAAGGDFFTFVVNSVPVDRAKLFSEDQARFFFRQLITAIGYIHSRHVAHRDVKLANVLLDSQRPPMIKLCDFGLSKTWHDMEELNAHTTVGTPAYMSPQVLEQLHKDVGYDPLAADVWSCGIFLYVMLLGRFPFKPMGGRELSLETNFRTILHHIHAMHQGGPGGLEAEALVDSAFEGAGLTDACKDLLNRCLTVDSAARATVPEILAHPWYRAPLLPEHAAALGALEKETLKGHSVKPDRGRGNAVQEASLQRLQRLVHEAVYAPMGLSGEVLTWTPEAWD